MLKGLKRSFAVVVVLFMKQLKLSKWNKNVQGERKMCKNNKKLLYKTSDKHEVHNCPLCYLLWHIVILKCSVWPFMTKYGLAQLYEALYDLQWSCMVLYSLGSFLLLWIYISRSQIQIHLVLFFFVYDNLRKRKDFQAENA